MRGKGNSEFFKSGVKLLPSQLRDQEGLGKGSQPLRFCLRGTCCKGKQVPTSRNSIHCPHLLLSVPRVTQVKAWPLLPCPSGRLQAALRGQVTMASSLFRPSGPLVPQGSPAGSQVKSSRQGAGSSRIMIAPVWPLSVQRLQSCPVCLHRRLSQDKALSQLMPAVDSPSFGAVQRESGFGPTGRYLAVLLYLGALQDSASRTALFPALPQVPKDRGHLSYLSPPSSVGYKVKFLGNSHHLLPSFSCIVMLPFLLQKFSGNLSHS